jgi:RsiW-degrading membrane proteinase PrsW (M82 family)
MVFLLGLVPVCAFLIALAMLDSYKLVSGGSLMASLGAGALAGCAGFVVNTLLLPPSGLSFVNFARYVAPVTEETLKATFLAYLLLTQRTGFLVDTAIHGFAIGAGFALVENTTFFLTHESANALLWLVRGFGTALMHGATVACAGLIAIVLMQRRGKIRAAALAPGLAGAVVIHSLFNHFFIPAVASTVTIVLLLPLLTAEVFRRSEKATAHWLGVGFDTDRELLEMITSGRLPDTRIGKYLQSLQERFQGVVVADMLCLLRLRLELSIQAKGLLMMREAGFPPPPDTGDAHDKFQELEFLENSIGKTGMLALLPFLHTPKMQLKRILRV